MIQKLNSRELEQYKKEYLENNGNRNDDKVQEMKNSLTNKIV